MQEVRCSLIALQQSGMSFCGDCVIVRDAIERDAKKGVPGLGTPLRVRM